MFRTLVTVGLACASVSAFAAPKVGDYAFFEGSDLVTGDPVNLEFRIVSEASGYMVVRGTLNVGGAIQTFDWGELEPELLLSAEGGQLIVDDCADAGYRLDTVTYAGSARPVCFSDGSPRIWFGAVPFGVFRFSGDLSDFPVSMEAAEAVSIYPNPLDIRLTDFGFGT